MFLLNDLYRDPDRVVVTAHRGFNSRYPENTLLAFRKAVEAGADIIEFDLRASADGVPVLLHDPTLDRTTDGTGRPEEFSLADLKRLNASWFQGPSVAGRRLAEPACADARVNTFEEVLKEFAGQPVGMNIQVYAGDDIIESICSLYAKYNLYKKAFLTVLDLKIAKLVRQFDPAIELCVLSIRGEIEKQRENGCVFMQPRREHVTPAFCQAVRDADICANMFYANEADDIRKYLGYGLRGILTDCPDVVLITAESLGLKTRKTEKNRE